MTKPANLFHFGELLVSPGELSDRLSILQIKRERILDENSGKFIQEEICKMSLALELIMNQFHHGIYDEWEPLMEKLTRLNEKQWDLEDRVRTESSWEAARAARENNTERVAIKNEICVLFGYPIEVKSYRG